jgi:Cys-tRNA(Pro)/Cys-tRNA(Cys) deacylase
MDLPAHQYLDKLNIPYEKAEFPPGIEKGAASVARALGYRERQMIKTLIFELDTGERILVMVGGDQNIVSGFLKKVFTHYLCTWIYWGFIGCLPSSR